MSATWIDDTFMKVLFHVLANNDVQPPPPMVEFLAELLHKRPQTICMILAGLREMGLVSFEDGKKKTLSGTFFLTWEILCQGRPLRGKKTTEIMSQAIANGRPAQSKG